MTTIPGRRWVDVDDRLVARLAAICPTDDGAVGGSSPGQDWWPLALQWAAAGVDIPGPAVVARPASPAQVAAVLAVCHEATVPVTAVGGRSGVCGGAMAVFGGVAMDVRALSGITSVDDESLLVTMGPGTMGDDLEAGLADHGLTLGHWPQSMAISTVGGWLACRSAGQYSTRYGTVSDMVRGLDVALADGRVIHTGGRAPRSAMGPDLTQLFVGSEGTLGVVTSAELRAQPRPTAHMATGFVFSTFEDGMAACRRILRRGATPAALRLYDGEESNRSFGVDAGCVLVVVDEGDPVLVDSVAAVVAEECQGAEAVGAGPAERWLAERFSWPPVHDLVEAGLVVDTCEVASRWSVLHRLYADCLARLRRRPGLLTASAHLSHAYGDGACIYLTFAGQPVVDGAATPAAGADWYRGAWDDLMAAVTAHGGAISHHHGIGLNRAPYLPGAMGASFATLVAVKQALDPRGILNPGKLGLPNPWGDPSWP